VNSQHWQAITPVDRLGGGRRVEPVAAIFDTYNAGPGNPLKNGKLNVRERPQVD
jgi:hypothetical protein